MKKQFTFYACLLLVQPLFAQIFSTVANPFFNDTTRSAYGVSFVEMNQVFQPDIYSSTWGGPILSVINNGSLFDSTAYIPYASASHAAITIADYDNNGFNDVFVCGYNGGSRLLTGNNGTLVYQNPVQPYIGYSSALGASWVNYNNDALLDLYVCNFSNGTNTLYRGESNGLLNPISVTGLTTTNGNHVSSSWADFDNDGDMDVFIANFSGQNNEHYIHSANHQFIPADTSIITNDGGKSHGGSWGDYDNDGDLDLYVTNSYNEANFLYRNDGNSSFTKITSIGAIGQNTSMCSAWGDVDNDGDLDLFCGNNSALGTLQTNQLFINNGNGFTADTADGSANYIAYSRGCGMADMNNDGYLDLFVSQDQNAPDKLFKNIGGNNNWLKIKLVGVQSNRSAIGARIITYHTYNGQSRMQVREVSAQTGYMSQNDLVQHLGVGTASKIDSMIIRWPSGFECRYGTLPVNQELTIVETCANEVSVVSEESFPNIQMFPNPVVDQLTVSGLSKATRIKIYAASGQLLKEQIADSFERTIIDVSGWSAGLYILTTDNGQSRRFVVNKR